MHSNIPKVFYDKFCLCLSVPITDWCRFDPEIVDKIVVKRALGVLDLECSEVPLHLHMIIPLIFFFLVHLLILKY